MLLPVILAATPAIAFVLDAPVDIDGRRVEQSTKLPWKPSYTVSSGPQTVQVVPRAKTLEIAVHSATDRLVVDLVEPGPQELRLVRLAHTMGAQYLLLNTSNEIFTFVDPWLSFDGRRARECGVKAPTLTRAIAFPRIDEACFVDARTGGSFSAEVRLAPEGQHGPVRLVFALVHSFVLAADAAKRRAPIVRRVLLQEDTCRCEGSPLWMPMAHPVGDYPHDGQLVDDR